MLCMIIVVRVHLDPKVHCSLGRSVPSRSASALRPSGTPPVTHLGSMHTHYLVDVSILDCGCFNPSVPSVFRDLGRFALPHCVSAFQGSSQRWAGEAKTVKM